MVDNSFRSPRVVPFRYVRQTEKEPEAWPELNDKDLFKGLRVCKLETQLSKRTSVLKRKEL